MKRWEIKIDGERLRDAIHRADLLDIKYELSVIYNTLFDKGIIDEYERMDMLDELEFIEDEDEMDYTLSDFYDLCDNLRIWITI